MPPPAVSLPRVALPHTDADAETDAETDTDAETETDTETDTDAEADAEADADAGTEGTGEGKLRPFYEATLVKRVLR